MEKDSSNPYLGKLDTTDISTNNNTILQKNCSVTENQGLVKCTQTSCENIELAYKKQEEFIRKEIEDVFNFEISSLTDRFDYILQNEQMRCSFMLRQAYREREEKISALQTQLECKNLAGLMYVLCTERRKAQLEKLNITEEYRNRIHELQDILTEGQSLILHLSRGYKTAAKIDHEWREKMKKVLFHFQNFIQDFCNGTKEDIQHLFDLPSLLNVKTSVEPDPNDDPCEPEENKPAQKNTERESEKQWWEKLDGDPSPFVVYGDLGDMKPNQRREVLRNVKAAKTAPTKWKDYVFNEMYMKAECPNIDYTKNEFKKQNPLNHLENHGVQTQDINSYQSSQFSHRMTTTTTMGSILKIITASLDPNRGASETTKASILGARDSMEIASTSKLMKDKSKDRHSETHSVKLSIGNRKNSILQELATQRQRQDSIRPTICEITRNEDENEEITADDIKSFIGSIAHDSMEIIQDHVPDKDAKIQYDKVCPVEDCQHLQVDSFIKSLPPYMRASPFLHFEQTFEEYEPCTPEQLKILEERIELSKLKSSTGPPKEHLLAEWSPVTDGVAVQTSEFLLPECNCAMSTKSKDSVLNHVFSSKDLSPVKATLDKIKKECLFDDQIQFNRFKVVGEDIPNKQTQENKKDFRSRLEDIQKVLRQHPSLCKIFQANTSC